jgi:hypothetical protein
MLVRSFAVVLVTLLLGFASAIAQTEQQSTDQQKPTKYERFLTRNDKLMVTKSYPVGKLPGGSGFDVSVRVAWALGETERVFAASIGGRIVDFEQLQAMLDGMDKMTEAIGGLFDKLEAASMHYSTPAGLKVNYYSYSDSSGTPRRNLYLVAGSYVSQSPTAEFLIETRNVIAQARAKLVSLGAQ